MVRPTTLMSSLGAPLQVDEEETASKPDRPIQEEKNQNLGTTETMIMMKMRIANNTTVDPNVR